MNNLKSFLTILTFTIISAGFCSSSATIKTGVLYRSSKVTDYWYYLKFFPDNSVIGISSLNKAKELKGWFNNSNPDVRQGVYSIKGDSVFFDLTSSNGVVNYRGLIKKKSLILHSKSQINGFEKTRSYKIKG